jgi:hypothetical protein
MSTGTLRKIKESNTQKGTNVMRVEYSDAGSYSDCESTRRTLPLPGAPNPHLCALVIWFGKNPATYRGENRNSPARTALEI